MSSELLLSTTPSGDHRALEINRTNKRPIKYSSPDPATMTINTTLRVHRSLVRAI